jgi:vancomycin permeability regulator SanA
VAILISVVLLLGASPFITVGIASSGRIVSLDQVEAHDVVIVYGAGLDEGRPSPYLAARLVIARDLFQLGKARVILVSGDNLSEYHNEPEAMKTWLIEQGIPADKIVEDFAGQDTYSTCVRARQVFGITSAILATQTYHLPRAIATCRLVGVDAVGVGDTTVKPDNPGRWLRYEFREALADVNMMYEVVTARRPILGPYEPGVDQALGNR